jgi:hypothetical protein
MTLRVTREVVERNRASQASAISQDIWKKYKDVISNGYNDMTLTALIAWMKKEYNFTAT